MLENRGYVIQIMCEMTDSLCNMVKCYEAIFYIQDIKNYFSLEMSPKVFRCSIDP